MAKDLRQRILDQHAAWRASWVQQLEMMERGELRTNSRKAGEAWKDTTQESIDHCKSQIAMIDEIDRQYKAT